MLKKLTTFPLMLVISPNPKEHHMMTAFRACVKIPFATVGMRGLKHCEKPFNSYIEMAWKWPYISLDCYCYCYSYWILGFWPSPLINPKIFSYHLKSLHHACRGSQDAFASMPPWAWWLGIATEWGPAETLLSSCWQVLAVDCHPDHASYYIYKHIHFIYVNDSHA